MEKSKEQKVIEFYVLCNKLKDVVRTGWKDWHVTRERVESVAEHIYGVQMLAIAMCKEFEYDIDLYKVIFMLAIHELEETIIGDLTFKQITKEEKNKIGHEAVHTILNNLLDGESIEKIILEFDERKTDEAKFAYHCDKLECDLQCKLYDEAKCVSVNNQGDTIHDPKVIEKIQNGKATWSMCWLENDKIRYSDDRNFMAVLEYAKEKNISN